MSEQSKTEIKSHDQPMLVLKYQRRKVVKRLIYFFPGLLLFAGFLTGLYRNMVLCRTARASIGGICYHVLNRGNERRDVFHDDDHHQLFIALIRETCARAATPRTPTNRGEKVECPLFGLAGWKACPTLQNSAYSTASHTEVLAGAIIGGACGVHSADEVTELQSSSAS